MSDDAVTTIGFLLFLVVAGRGFWIWSQLSMAMSQFLDHLRRTEPEKWAFYTRVGQPASYRRRGLEKFEELIQQIELQEPIKSDIKRYMYWRSQFQQFPIHILCGLFLLIGVGLLISCF